MRDVLVLCYHAVSDDWPAAMAVTKRQLDQQLTLLTERGYVGTTFLQAVREPPAEKTVAITFDDGYRSVAELAAPLLARFGFPGTVFVPTSYVGGGPMSWPGIEGWVDGPYRDELIPLSWEELKELSAAGWEVGSHTRTHPRLTRLGDDELVAELEGSRRDCCSAMGVECRTIAYPFGQADRRVAEAAERAGFEAGAALPHPVPTRAEAFLWPRVGVDRADDLRRFGRKASPVMRIVRRSPGWRLVQLRHRLKPGRSPRE